MDLRKSIVDQTSFALRLAARVASTKANDANLVFSPLSIHLVLSLVAAGSKGQTLQQISSFLCSVDRSADDLNAFASQVVSLVLADGSPSGGPRISFVNGVWVDQTLPLKPSFEKVARGTYAAEARSVDFLTKAVDVTNEVNSWVEKETAGLIQELLPTGSLDHTTRLVLANSLYFKGAWTDKFESSKTKKYDFQLVDGNTVQAPFMTSTNKQYVRSFDGFKTLRLPYNQGQDKRQFSMYIFLPDARDGIWSLAEKLSSESEFVDRHLPTQKVGVGEFRIPKFKISFGFEVSEILKGMGLMLPFGGECDLTEMVDSAVAKNLFVSNIFHKSFIEVNEEGTEASAASAAVITLRSLQMGPEDFVADHPFIFIIKEDMTGVVMFTGHVVNPLLSC